MKKTDFHEIHALFMPCIYIYIYIIYSLFSLVGMQRWYAALVCSVGPVTNFGRPSVWYTILVKLITAWCHMASGNYSATVAVVATTQNSSNSFPIYYRSNNCYRYLYRDFLLNTHLINVPIKFSYWSPVDYSYGVCCPSCIGKHGLGKLFHCRRRRCHHPK